MIGHTQIEELIAAYALDSLEGSEALEAQREILDHLASCATCPGLFQDLRETAADLAWATPAAPIPAALCDRVMAAVAPAQPVSLEDRRKTRGVLGQSRLVQGLLAASISVALGLGGLSVALSGELRQSRGDRRLGEQALALVNDPTTEVITMTAAPGAGRMTLAARSDGRGMLIGTDLRLPEDRVFEVWRRRGAELIPVTTFVPVEGQALVDLRLDPRRDAGLAVTVERQRVEHPTTKPVFESSLVA